MNGFGIILVLAIGIFASTDAVAPAPTKAPGWAPFKQSAKQAYIFAKKAAKTGFAKIKKLFGDLELQKDARRMQENERLASLLDQQEMPDVSDAEEMLGREIFNQIVANEILEEENN